MEKEKTDSKPKEKERIPRLYADMRPEYVDPEFLYLTDKYDADFIWDGETVDDEKP